MTEEQERRFRQALRELEEKLRGKQEPPANEKAALSSLQSGYLGVLLRRSRP